MRQVRLVLTYVVQDSRISAVTFIPLAEVKVEWGLASKLILIQSIGGGDQFNARSNGWEDQAERCSE